MNVKIDTKEKFTVLTPVIADLSANMTAELISLMLEYLKKDIPHIVLNLKNVLSINEDILEKIAIIQQQFYERNNSFIICEMKKDYKRLFKKNELLQAMNITPTESEAYDMVQMEEIEREFMGDQI